MNDEFGIVNDDLERGGRASGIENDESGIGSLAVKGIVPNEPGIRLSMV